MVGVVKIDTTQEVEIGQSIGQGGEVCKKMNLREGGRERRGEGGRGYEERKGRRRHMEVKGEDKRRGRRDVGGEGGGDKGKEGRRGA